jgi:hypothetical protein
LPTTEVTEADPGRGRRLNEPAKITPGHAALSWICPFHPLAATLTGTNVMMRGTAELLALWMVPTSSWVWVGVRLRCEPPRALQQNRSARTGNDPDGVWARGR